MLLSLVSVWEIAIKHSIGSGDMPISAAEALGWAEDSGFELLMLTPAHLLTLEQLPFYRNDPFDRLLIAQSVSEALTLVSADSQFKVYGLRLQSAND